MQVRRRQRALLFRDPQQHRIKLHKSIVHRAMFQVAAITILGPRLHHAGACFVEGEKRPTVAGKPAPVLYFSLDPQKLALIVAIANDRSLAN